MIQAAPLVLSFARAVPMLNKLVGAVGITELGNRVNNYIQENPEESEKIVSMIMPAQGIANALKNKSSEDVEEVEETEEVTTGSGVEERIREILREAGVEDADNQDLTDLPKDLEAKVMSGIAKSSTDRKKDMIEASAIIGLSGPGREKKIMIDEVAKRYDEGGVEEVGNPKFNFTKFYKNRRRKADGGSIGIEVLFENKNPRQGLFMGGSPLDGQALAIYNSMKAYNFSDQEIANALSAQGLYTAPGSGTPETTTPNIIGSQINQGGGGDGIQSIGPQNIASFTETVEARQNRLNKPGKIADFINSNLGKIGINTQRSANEMLASGIKDTRATSGIPLGISGMIARALPNAYTDKLTLGEQVFSQENMGFTGQGNMANKDPFGINVVSAFGNYADYVKDRVAELEDIVADQKKRGLTDTYQMKELAFRSKQDIDRQNRISDAAKIQELQRIEKERIAKANTARQVVMEEARQRGDNPSAGSFSSNSPGGISQQTSRDARGGMSGWGLRDGGLATMFTRKR